MPILFLILADKLGIDMALATAPLHMFVRHENACGRVVNLETTSGALPARDVWYRQNFPMSDTALRNGLYMRSLPRCEAVAHMASTVVEHLLAERRYQEAAEASAVILAHAPRDAYVLVKQATAHAHLIRTEFTEKYPKPPLVPLRLRSRYVALCERNRAGFEAAEALGWRDAE